METLICKIPASLSLKQIYNWILADKKIHNHLLFLQSTRDIFVLFFCNFFLPRQNCIIPGSLFSKERHLCKYNIILLFANILSYVPV